MVLVSSRKHARTQLSVNHRLAPKASGPFIITEAIGHRTFNLNLTSLITRRFHNAFHATYLIPYVLRIPGDEPPVHIDAGAADDVDGSDPQPPDGPWRPVPPDDNNQSSRDEQDEWEQLPRDTDIPEDWQRDSSLVPCPRS